MRIILARHGETNWNKEGRIQGLSDLELNDTGRTQAEELAKALQKEKVAIIYSSPLKRARDTAQAINQFHNVELLSHDGLREIDAGEVDGLTYAELQTYYGDFFKKWMANCATVRPPGGCTVPEVQERAWAAIEEIVTKEKPRFSGNKDGVVVVVAHFFPIRTILCKIFDLDVSECKRIRLDLASICILDFTPDRIELVRMNEACHWKEGDR